MGLPRLTRREQQVVLLVAQGLTDKEIGRRLGIKRSTVAWYLREVSGRLGVTDRVSVTVVALRTGLITFAMIDAGPDAALRPE
jgi:DNA-binding NarL/FixJ family response regulator